MDTKDIREICDDVYQKTLVSVKEELSKIQPQIVNSIIVEVEKSLDKKYSKRIKKLEDKLSDLQDQLDEFVGEDGEDLNIDLPYGFRHNGWVYYANKDMGDFLYKIKIDGTNNTQLTDYSVWSSGYYVSDGYIYFTDRNYRKLKIKVD